MEDVKLVKISEITVGKRIRKTTFGNIKGLAQSIKKFGLLQPIGVTKKETRLIFGERRLRAIKLNGDSHIKCSIFDIDNILEAEYEENDFRESLSLVEKAAFAEELKKSMPKRLGGDRQSKKAKAVCSVGQTALKGNTRTHVAAKAGFTNEVEMQRVQTVIKKGTPALIEAMDKGKISISAAETLSKKPKEDQAAYLKSHQTHNGQFQESRALLFEKKMQEIIARVRGVKEQYGSALKMFNSPDWATSTGKEKERCIQTTSTAAELLSGLSQEMKSIKE